MVAYTRMSGASEAAGPGQKLAGKHRNSCWGMVGA